MNHPERTNNTNGHLQKDGLRMIEPPLSQDWSPSSHKNHPIFFFFFFFLALLAWSEPFI
jgi:hypothetical protein